MRFGEFVEINPKVKIQKGQEYPFVEMDAVKPTRRYVQAKQSREFGGGGSKFRVRDTLFARITPCLENGKIAQFIDEENEVGFGSTEFIVFRAKQGISDTSFVYYLARTHTIRGPAEKSMSGASGRQRADAEVIGNIEIEVPSLDVQQKIATILSAYDDLIENNLRRIKILEEMAQSLYREWFVKFRFPGHQKIKMVDSPLGKIPEGWKVKRLGEAIELAYGKGLKEQDRIHGDVAVYGSSGVVGYHNKSLVEGPGIIVGRKGNVGSVHWTGAPFFPIDTVFYVITKLPLHYVYFNLQTQNFISGDAAVPGLNRNQAYSLPFISPTPEVLRFFSQTIEPIFNLLNLLKKKNDVLCRTRDLLLPKLISGELDVSELDITIPEANA